MAGTWRLFCTTSGGFPRMEKGVPCGLVKHGGGRDWVLSGVRTLVQILCFLHNFVINIIAVIVRFHVISVSNKLFFSQPTIFTLCGSNSPLHPAIGEREEGGGTSE